MKKIFGFLVILMASASMSHAALLASWTFTGGSTAGTVNGASGLGGTTDNFTNYGTAPATPPTTTTSGRPGTKYYGINGSASAGVWNTGYIFNPVDGVGPPPQTIFDVVDKNKGNKFGYTSTRPVKDLIISDLKFSLKVASETSPDVTPNFFADTTVLVYAAINGGAFNYYGKGTSASSTGLPTSVSVPMSVALAPGQKIEFALSYVGSAGYLNPVTEAFGTRNFRFSLDDIQLLGEERIDVVPEPSSMAIFGLSLAGIAIRRRMKSRS